MSQLEFESPSLSVSEKEFQMEWWLASRLGWLWGSLLG
jgi:hypothetical protein